MLKNWFGTRESQEFGINLAESYSTELSIIDKKAEKSSTLNKRAKLLIRLVLDAKQFGQANRLNFFQKAKLCNAFKWTLLGKGYDAEFVDKLTKEVILALK